MNQNDALRKARLILGLDAEVGRVPGKGPEARFCIASKAHNLSLRGPSFEALIGALETYGIHSPADAKPEPDDAP